MGEPSDSGGGGNEDRPGSDNVVDRSNPREMAAREKAFREDLGFTGTQGRDEFAAAVDRGDFAATQELERQAAERQFSSTAQRIDDAMQRQADDERDARQRAADTIALADTSIDVDPTPAQQIMENIARSDAGMVTDVDPFAGPEVVTPVPVPSGGLFGDEMMRQVNLTQRMLADEKTMFPPDFEAKYGYSNVPKVGIATLPDTATAANVLQGTTTPASDFLIGQQSSVARPGLVGTAADGTPITTNEFQSVYVDGRGMNVPRPQMSVINTAAADPMTQLSQQQAIFGLGDNAPASNPLLTGQDGPTTPNVTTGRDIDPSPDDDQQYDSRGDVKAYQDAMRQASGGSFLDKFVAGFTGGKSDAEIAAINKAYTDRPASARGISPGLALAVTGDEALAGRLGGSIAMDTQGNQVPLTGDMLADLNTRATGLGKFFNNNTLNAIADGGTAVVNDGKIEGAISATGSYTGNNAFNPYGAKNVDGGSDPFNQPPVDPCPPGYQMRDGVCQPVDDLISPDPPRTPGEDFVINPTTGLPTLFTPATQATQVGQINPFVLQPYAPQQIAAPTQGIQVLSPTGAALGRQV